MTTPVKQKTVVVGAGPVGALAALYAARRGHSVEVYELRGDLRDASTTPLNFTKSINLALSERGIHSMRESGCHDLVKNILNDSIPMYGRMVHGKDSKGELFEQSQQYDIYRRAIRAVDRAGLNTHLLNALAALPNVSLFFHHKLTGADFSRKLAWLLSPSGEEIEIRFDFLIGADGAHSSVRYHLMKYTRLDYQQSYIDTLWCEFRIPPSQENTYRLSSSHLHIWPSSSTEPSTTGSKMFIAIPSLDSSFTCTLFLPSSVFASLNRTALLPFFTAHFPGVVPNLISEPDLLAQFSTNPHLPLISIKCAPFHHSSSVVILGDAAHAMVPFYGQGMNAGLEDVRVLFGHLDAHSATPEGRVAALAAYTAERAPDAHTINDLAMGNYEEMSRGVVSPVYKLRKAVEEWVSKRFPQTGWKTQYARVSFGNERYSEVRRRIEAQGRWLAWGGVAIGMLGVGAGLGGWWLRRRR